MVKANLIRIRSNAGNRLFLSGHQRTAHSGPADERLGQLLGLARISTGLLVDELPEATHVLLQLAQNKIGPVAADIFFFRHIFGVQ